MSELPLAVKISLEGLRERVVNHITVVYGNYSEKLREAIDNAIETYPWEKQVEDIVHEQISANIKQYFLYGEGGEVIRAGINEAFKRASSKRKD